VKAYVKDHPEDVQRVYDVEVDGKGRQTLLDWLTAD
jgi:meiotically up-regulated gene 157 (Mug157) protein